MKCPNCNTTLVMADRQGIEIDYCPDCRGVWLDRGELDKIIERANNDMSSSRGNVPRTSRRDDDDSDEFERPKFGKSPKKKMTSMLGDLFEF